MLRYVYLGQEHSIEDLLRQQGTHDVAAWGGMSRRLLERMNTLLPEMVVVVVPVAVLAGTLAGHDTRLALRSAKM